jgi:putative Mn2+ efflux pump MntP
MISLVFIALSLSLDAFAVSISSGISIRDLKAFHVLRASFFFGVFQFAMPLAGWYLGSAFAAYISAYDHWIAFVILAFIGGKMILEALRGKEYPRGNKDAPREEAPRAEVPGGGSLQSGVPGGKALCKKNSKFNLLRKTHIGDIRSLRTLLSLAVATSIDALAVGVSFAMFGRGIWGDAAVIGAITFLVCLSGFEFGRRIGLLFEKRASIIGGFVLIGIGLKILLEQ